MKDYQLDGNKEMVALGAMNVVGSMTSCYVATGKLQDLFLNLPIFRHQIQLQERCKKWSCMIKYTIPDSNIIKREVIFDGAKY